MLAVLRKKIQVEQPTSNPETTQLLGTNIPLYTQKTAKIPKKTSDRITRSWKPCQQVEAQITVIPFPALMSMRSYHGSYLWGNCHPNNGEFWKFLDLFHNAGLLTNIFSNFYFFISPIVVPLAFGWTLNHLSIFCFLLSVFFICISPHLLVLVPWFSSWHLQAGIGIRSRSSSGFLDQLRTLEWHKSTEHTVYALDALQTDLHITENQHCFLCAFSLSLANIGWRCLACFPARLRSFGFPAFFSRIVLTDIVVLCCNSD